jgi:3-oxoacyl-[acyl-carrier-protein] synthase III
MARTIEIDDAVWERLCEKARQLGCDAEVLAQSLLAESLQQECAQAEPLWGEARRLLNEMTGSRERQTVEEGRLVLTPQLAVQWHSLMDRLIGELGITPEEIEADITHAFEEYRRECSS